MPHGSVSDLPPILKERKERLRRKTRTYFIQASNKRHAPIKIGKAVDIKKRMSALQGATYMRLHLLGYLLGDHEDRMHIRFGDDRIRGEWFRCSNALLCFIRDNCRNPKVRCEDRC